MIASMFDMTRISLKKENAFPLERLHRWCRLPAWVPRRGAKHLDPAGDIVLYQAGIGK